MKNVFIFKSGRIKIGDFGISKFLENTQKLASTTIGTPYYISPEICSGQTYSFKSDIWSLGCLLYEMITRKKPFKGTHMHEIFFNILGGNYEELSEEFSKNL